jgi:ribosomal protein L7Ae-like RNA K-turn-binding protein
MNPWSNVLGTLGICLKAKKLAAGADAVSDFFQMGHARLILLSQDAGQSIRRKAAFLESKSPAVAVSVIPCTKEEMGQALGKKTCSICCISDAGFAASVSQRLAEVSPENQQAAEKMRSRKERIDQRKSKKHKSKKQEACEPIEENQRKQKKNCGGAC